MQLWSYSTTVDLARHAMTVLKYIENDDREASTMTSKTLISVVSIASSIESWSLRLVSMSEGGGGEK
jgi:hypothetical protein